MSLIRLAKTGLFKRLEIPSEEVAKELLLHRAVLDKALIDLFSPQTEIREDVENWLDVNNIDFKEACERALLDHNLVFATFKAMKRILRGKNARFNRVRTNRQ